MKKHVLFLIFFVYQSSRPTWWDGKVSLSMCLEKHAVAFTKLEPHASKITFSQWKEHFGKNTMTHNEWLCSSYEAKQCVQDYITAEKNLSELLFANAVGDGLCAGVIVALLNNLVGAEVYNLKSWGLLGASAMGTILVRNYKHQGVPYFDYPLKRHDNYFSHVGSIPHMLLAVGGAAMGYLGATYVLAKISDISDIYGAVSANIAKK